MGKAGAASRGFTAGAAKDFSALGSIFQGVGQAIGQHLIGAITGLGSGMFNAAGAATQLAQTVGLSADKMQFRRLRQPLMTSPNRWKSFRRRRKVDGNYRSPSRRPRVFTRLASRWAISEDDARGAARGGRRQALSDPRPGQRAAAATAIFGNGLAGHGHRCSTPGATPSGRSAAEADRLGPGHVRPESSPQAATSTTRSRACPMALGRVDRATSARPMITSEPLYVLFEGLVEILGTFSKGGQDGPGRPRSFVDFGGVFRGGEGSWASCGVV